MTLIYSSGSTGNNIHAVGWIVSSKVPYCSWCCTWTVLGIRTNLPYWGIILCTQLAPTGTGAVHTHSSNLVICLVSALCWKYTRSSTRNPSYDDCVWTWDWNLGPPKYEVKSLFFNVWGPSCIVLHMQLNKYGTRKYKPGCHVESYQHIFDSTKQYYSYAFAAMHFGSDVPSSGEQSHLVHYCDF